MSSLYVHIPFCEKKCFYCSFAVVIGQERRAEDYLRALGSEAVAYPETIVDTVYVGGGTPTLLKPEQLEQLVKFITGRFCLRGECEFTMEANPEGLDFKKARLLKQLGINRVSLGIQSLNDDYLKFLGRCHDGASALRAFDHLRAAGFKNINVDLMCSFPGQTDEQLKKDIRAVSDLGSEHISLYALNVEPYSRFYAQKLKLDADHRRAEQYLIVVDSLEQAGFRQYEVSNFAKQEFESRHNINYWTGGEYIGLGVGAHSHIAGRRFWNGSQLKQYLDSVSAGKSPTAGEEILSAQQRFWETLLIGLRMNRGVDVLSLEKKFGYAVPLGKRTKINELIKSGFLQQNRGFLQATSHGRLVLDELSAELI